MNNLSERVQREFEEWKEKYEIPHHMEFEVKTLLKLQEEYNLVEVGSNTTKTRETLLNMISYLHRELRLSEKKQKTMYVTHFSHADTIFIYIDNCLYHFKGTLKQCSEKVIEMALIKNAKIYIDSSGTSRAIMDTIQENSSINIEKLNIIDI